MTLSEQNWNSLLKVVHQPGQVHPATWRISDARKPEKPEEIASKLRQVEVLQGQGATIAEAVRQIGATQQTFFRSRMLHRGMQRSRFVRLKEMEKASQRLRRAVSDLSLDRLTLTGAARGND